MLGNLEVQVGQVHSIACVLSASESLAATGRWGPKQTQLCRRPPSSVVRAAAALTWKQKDRAPKDHINTRITNSGSKDIFLGDTSNHVLSDPHVYVVFWGP